ncbi:MULTISPECIES: hypothetical protein [Pseudomonas]|uniref:hypothetical protein n=1 Tax=Pseudomonas TaxID=286 RepID=UPI001BE9562F|nr:MULTISPECIES: hypothetical protein [Pseudomonas]MBT2337748.1 hypothetical protein [Pseudomonas fluorescens]MCD4528057.1 hypothetical protein [Pseudomonas sp. C3-2018]
MPNRSRCTSPALGVLFFCSEVWAEEPYVDIGTTLCREGETIYISCALNGGSNQYDYEGAVASICAKKNTSPDQGYVQYRYGTPTYGYKKERLEFQYPEKKKPPRGVFKIYISSNPESLGVALVFTRGEYTYSFESLEVMKYKVVVRKGAEKIFDKRCTLPGKNYLVDKAYQGIEQINNDHKLLIFKRD